MTSYPFRQAAFHKAWCADVIGHSPHGRDLERPLRQGAID